MLDSNGVAQYPWNHGETLTAAALNAAIAQAAEGTISGQAVNVLDFGANPAGGVDCSAAFNAALAFASADGQVNKAVYVPTGLYRLDHTIHMKNAQTLFGDGRGVSRIYCDGNFNISQAAVISLDGTTTGQINGVEIRGLTISMVQDMNNTVRANCVQYPPVISCQAGAGRVKILNCQIAGAWNGYTDNGNNVCFDFIDLELGALNVGISVGVGATGPQDFCHIHGLHFWAFGCPSAVFQDGNTVAMHMGVGGVNCNDFSNFQGQIIIDGAGSGVTSSHFTNLMLDADQASITINGGLHTHISNIYSTADTARTRAAVSVNASTLVTISNWYSHNSSPFPMFDVQAGELSVENAHIRHYALNSPVGQTSTGNALLKVTTATVWAGSAGAYTQPLFVQGGGGSRMRIDNLTVDNLGLTNSGAAALFHSDTLGNLLGTVSLAANWQTSVPSGAINTQPQYRGGLVVSATPSPTYGQLELTSLDAGSINGLESKIRFHGSFPGGTDYYPYLAASLRGGWSATSWTGSYLNVWLTNAANSATSDANMVRVAGFTVAGMFLPLLATSTSYANDAAAATGGVAVGQLYRNGSAVMCRIT